MYMKFILFVSGLQLLLNMFSCLAFSGHTVVLSQLHKTTSHTISYLFICRIIDKAMN